MDKTFTTFTTNVKNGARNRRLNSPDDQDHCLDPGIFRGVLIIALLSHSKFIYLGFYVAFNTVQVKYDG